MLDFKTLLIVNAVTLFLMALTLPVTMGSKLSPAATSARAALLAQALAWAGYLLTGLLGMAWQAHVPEFVGAAYAAAGMWLMPTFSVACISASTWLMFKALQGWLGERQGERLLLVLVVLSPVGYALAYSSYALRVGWSNALIAAALLVVAYATLHPANESKSSWRWVIFACTVVMAILTATRGVLGAFYTVDYPSFSTPHPVNLLALLMTLVSLVLVNMSVLVAWRQEAEAQLRNHAYTDALTGLHNRHAWELRAPAMFDHAKRHGLPLALLVMDLDFFKRINDTLGHEAGDHVLSLFGQTIEANRRSSDLAARLGGEEFALLLPQTGQDDALLFEQRFRSALKQACIEQPELAVDYSAGLAMIKSGDTSLTAFMARADRRLYRAKASGRGQLQFSG
jgi:diguanylate cyclase (GGDEF)-like protein